MKGHYFPYAAGEALSRFLPKSAAYGLASAVGKIYPIIFPSDFRCVMDNLKAVFPAGTEEGVLRRCAKELFANFGRYLVEFLYADRVSGGFMEKNVEIRGLEHLEEALKRGRGAVLASAHIGHWELGAIILAKKGFPVHGIALRHQDPRIDGFFQKRRQKNGLRVIPVGHSLKVCYRVLAGNGVLALNADRLFGSDGVRVKFFGREVLFPQGFSRMSRSTLAPVLPVFCLMRERRRYLLEIGPPMPGEEEQAQTRRFAGLVEQKIRQYPSQWFLFQPFWERPRWPT